MIDYVYLIGDFAGQGRSQLFRAATGELLWQAVISPAGSVVFPDYPMMPPPTSENVWIETRTTQEAHMAQKSKQGFTLSTAEARRFSCGGWEIEVAGGPLRDGGDDPTWRFLRQPDPARTRDQADLHALAIVAHAADVWAWDG